MSEHRSFASLTGSLLARKGAARPAMRSPLNLRGGHAPLGNGGLSVPEADDLGWNDMHGEAASVEATPRPAPSSPSVVELQQAISARLAIVADRSEKAVAKHQPEPIAPTAPTPAAKPAKASRRRSALADGRRAAFTLRIDAERHLKLRLACTLQNRSAQMLVIEALDRLFAEEPTLAVLAAQITSKV